jgi:HEAT repeat protein
VLLDSVAYFLMSDTETRNLGYAAHAVVRLAEHSRPRSLRVLRNALQRWPGDLSLVAAAGEVKDTALYLQLTLIVATGAPRLRAAATYALAHFKTADARKTMRSALALTPVDWYAVKAFYVWPDTQALDRLSQIGEDTSSSSSAQWWAVKALGKLGNPRAIPVLRSIADRGDADQLSKAARDAIAEIEGPLPRGRRP